MVLLTPSRAISAVCAVSGLQPPDIVGYAITRERKLAKALVIHLCTKTGSFSQHDISSALCMKSHRQIRCYCDLWKDLRKSDLPVKIGDVKMPSVSWESVIYNVADSFFNING